MSQKIDLEASKNEDRHKSQVTSLKPQIIKFALHRLRA
jgi:hypothetical protein